MQRSPTAAHARARLTTPTPSPASRAVSTTRRRPPRTTGLIFVATCALLGLASTPLSAATYRVGLGDGCSHATIAAAIAAAEANPGADTIRVTRSLAYQQQSVILTTSQELEVTGGYATCAQASNDGVRTIIDGAGGATDPVLRITANTGALIRLRHLTIQGGDEDGDGLGGGIYFRGDGRLEIRDSHLQNNVAGYGGGLYALGQGPNAELVIGSGVIVGSNIARYSGGGVYVNSMRLTMTEPGSGFIFNQAVGLNDSGFGGGLMLLSSSRPASARISSGLGGLGVAYGNEARRGGGIAVVAGEGTDHDVHLSLFTSQANLPAAIKGNLASVSGGGLYVRANEAFYSRADAHATLWQATLDANAAPAGGAIHLDYTTDVTGLSALGGSLRFNHGQPPSGALACPSGAACGAITNNVASSATGAVVHVGETAYFNYEPEGPMPSAGILFRGNSGGYLIRVVDSLPVTLRNAVMVENEVGHQLLRSQEGSGLSIIDSTLAGNSIGAAQVIAADGNVSLRRSILWQPGKTSLTQSSGSRTVEFVLANENASLGGAPAAISEAPRFIDPANGDYRLRAASPAIDHAPADTTAPRDTHNLPHDLRLPLVPRPAGLSRDIGAHERQAVQMLVLNGDFASDLRLWTIGGYSSWHADSAVGGAGSGSTFVGFSNTSLPSITGASQCVQLPGPATYALNGWSLSPGIVGAGRDHLSLRWRFRRDGGEGCTGGSADLEGNHILPRQNVWATAATASLIEVLPQQWTRNSSIEITMIVSEGSDVSPHNLTGYFDGISLVVAGDDPQPFHPLLSDGFE